MMRRMLPLAVGVWCLALMSVSAPKAAPAVPQKSEGRAASLFQTADACIACHNGLSTESGEDVSIGSAWRASMMANSARDPYWQASVRRETIDHAALKDEIEDECATCHMPMSRTHAQASGRPGEIFAHLPIGRDPSGDDRLAADGVSCTLCHQIGSERLGTPQSFTGGYVITRGGSMEAPIFGPFDTDAGRTKVMHSATGMTPAESTHVRQSELCATCHTLYTRAFDTRGELVGRLPEQVPYLEWRHSAIDDERSCQSCHMPAIEAPTAISSVLGEPRVGFGRHTFLGGNFFMLQMLGRYRNELGVHALPHELEASARATVRQLQADTATVAANAVRRGSDLQIDVEVSNLTGHKLPTGYPSRRAWLHLTVRDAAGRALFESGALHASGAIEGSDNDEDPARYEAHHREIRSQTDVQIYESVMIDVAGAVTTGLLSATSFVKDNRLLPRGFDKSTAAADIAVRGGAESDPDFADDGDRVRFLVDVGRAVGPFQVDVELRYQPISFRWAQNLTRYDAQETKRFVTYFAAMAEASSTVLAWAAIRTD